MLKPSAIFWPSSGMLGPVLLMCLVLAWVAGAPAPRACVAATPTQPDPPGWGRPGLWLAASRQAGGEALLHRLTLREGTPGGASCLPHSIAVACYSGRCAPGGRRSRESLSAHTPGSVPRGLGAGSRDLFTASAAARLLGRDPAVLGFAPRLALSLSLCRPRSSLLSRVLVLARAPARALSVSLALLRALGALRSVSFARAPGVPSRIP